MTTASRPSQPRRPAGDELDALRAYQSQRDQLSMDLFEVTDALANGNWTEEDIDGLLRSQSAAMTPEVTVLEDLGTWPTADREPATREVTACA